MSKAYSEKTPAGATYATNPDFESLFEPEVWKLYPRAVAGNDAAFSFDGVNDHGKVFGGVQATVGNVPVIEVGPMKKLWLRIVLGTPIVGVSVSSE